MQNPLRPIYPHHCPTCDTLTGGPDALCGDCWITLARAGKDI
ncbi:double zinc ribbon domain-containing protein [Nereida ignava]